MKKQNDEDDTNYLIGPNTTEPTNIQSEVTQVANQTVTGLEEFGNDNTENRCWPTCRLQRRERCLGCSWDGGDCCGNTNKVRHGF